VPAPASGYVEAIAATDVGLAALHLGAGRVRKEDAIDHAVGVVCLAKRGDRAVAGEPLAEVHARDEDSAARAVEEIVACYRLGDGEPERRPIVLDVLS
jgi:thymidine phosphorylase